MLQVLFRIPIYTSYSPDGIPIYGFGMMLFLAFLICTWLAGRRAMLEGIRKEVIQDLAIPVFLGGLLGARTTYLLSERSVTSFGDFLMQLPKIWDGGIVLYGSFLGGTLGYFLAWSLYYRKQGLQTRRVIDAVAPAIAIGVALGRLGCLLNGCCYGQVACAECVSVVPVTFPLSAPCRDRLVETGRQTPAGFTLQPGGTVIDVVEPGSAAERAGLRPGLFIDEINGKSIRNNPDGMQPNEAVNRWLGRLGDWPRGESELTLKCSDPRTGTSQDYTFSPRTVGLYPTQVYETISMTLLLLVLLAYHPLRRNPGQVTAVLMVGYGLHRFLNELLREDDRPVGLESYTSIFLVAAGVVLWLWLEFKPADPPVEPIRDTEPTPEIKPEVNPQIATPGIPPEAAMS